MHFAFCISLLFSGCADTAHQVVISVPEQRMVVLEHGMTQAVYPVSTSRFCLGDTPGTNGTPLGELEIARKIGDGQPAGTVFKSREPTGEIVRVNAPGRDPIVTRILWLRGLEPRNANAYDRYIYIHGTPEENRIGTPASFGCVRMRSRDIIALYDTVGRGAHVYIENKPLARAAGPLLAAGATVPPATPPTSPVAVATNAARAAATPANGPQPFAAPPPAARRPVTGP